MSQVEDQGFFMKKRPSEAVWHSPCIELCTYQRILMIVGFTEENKGRFCQKVGSANSDGTAIGRWSAEIGGKAIASSPFAQRSILGRYHIFAIKRLQQKANASEWDKSVQGFTKNGSCQ